MPEPINPRDYLRMYTAQKRSFWKEHPLVGDIGIEVPGVPPLVMRCNNDDTVVKELYWTENKGWEYASLRLWQTICESIDDGMVLDVGSYTGIYALVAALSSPSAEVAAFDIQEVCVDRIATNARLNRVEFTVRRLAASSHASELEFYHGSTPEMISSVASLTPNQFSPTRAVVPAGRLDDTVDDPASVKLVKIDVEGAELDVLGGMNEIIERASPDILIEVNDIKSIGEVLATAGDQYACFQIDDRYPGQIKKLPRFLRRKLGRNYLLTTRSTVPEIGER